VPTQASILSHSRAPSTPPTSHPGKESEKAAGKWAHTFGGKQCDPLHYGLMRQSLVALRYFGFWPRSWSLRRLLPAPAATGTIPTLSLQICPRMPGPLPRRSHRVHLPVSSSVSSAFPRHSLGRLPVGIRERDFSAGYFSRLQTFLYVQASEFARLPGRSYRREYFRRAAEAFTSGLIVLRCLRTHRICYPSENRQLTEKGLPPF
jgi:hypothetical protein